MRFLLLILLLIPFGLKAANPSFADFNTNQFGTNGFVLSIKSGAPITNAVLGAATALTLDTGQGANELYDMDQDVLTTSSPTFKTVQSTNFLTFGSWTNYPGLLLAVSADSLTNAVNTPITNWSGFGLPLTNAAANAPTIQVGGMGYPGANFIGGTNWLVFPSTAWLNTNITVFIVAEATNNWGLGSRVLLGGTVCALAWSHNYAVGNRFLADYATSGGISTAGNNLLVLDYPVSSTPTVTSALTFRWKFGETNVPDSVLIGVNGSVITGTATNGVLSWPFSGSTYVGIARTKSAATAFPGFIYELAIYTNALPVDSMNHITAYLRAKYSTKDVGYLVADGDAGFIGGAMNANAKQFSPVFYQFDKSLKSHSSTISASTLRTLEDVQSFVTNRSTGPIALRSYQGSIDKIYLLYMGTQCLQTNTAAFLWPIMSNCMSSATSLGWIVPAFTLLPAGGTNDTERLSYNSLVRTYWPNVASVLVDLQSLPFTGTDDYTNSVYYTSDGNSGYMPTVYMSTLVTAFVNKRLRSLLSSDIIVK